MTWPVFGDFLGAVAEHLEAAVAAGDRQPADLRTIVAPLHRLVAVMSRVTEDLAPCDEIEAAGRTDLRVWERAIIDTGSALRIAADCLYRCGPEPDLRLAEPSSQPSQARHLADAASALSAGRDLLFTHIALGPDGVIQDRSGWSPVITSLPVTRALANEIALWSARLAPVTARLAGPAAPLNTNRGADRTIARSSRRNSSTRRDGCAPPEPRCDRRSAPTRSARQMPSFCTPSRPLSRGHASRLAPPRSRSPNCAAESPSARPGSAQSPTSTKTASAGNPTAP